MWLLKPGSLDLNLELNFQITWWSLGKGNKQFLLIDIVMVIVDYNCDTGNLSRTNNFSSRKDSHLITYMVRLQLD